MGYLQTEVVLQICAQKHFMSCAGTDLINSDYSGKTLEQLFSRVGSSWSVDASSSRGLCQFNDTKQWNVFNWTCIWFLKTEPHNSNQHLCAAQWLICTGGTVVGDVPNKVLTGHCLLSVSRALSVNLRVGSCCCVTSWVFSLLSHTLAAALQGPYITTSSRLAASLFSVFTGKAESELLSLTSLHWWADLFSCRRRQRLINRSENTSWSNDMTTESTQRCLLSLSAGFHGFTLFWNGEKWYQLSSTSLPPVYVLLPPCHWIHKQNALTRVRQVTFAFSTCWD